MSATKRYLILSIVLAVIAGAIGAACAVHWLSHRGQTSSLHQLVHDDLGLTAEQLTRIDAAEARFATRRVALEQEMQAANRQLASAIEADKSYGPEAQAAINRFHGAMGELQEQTILHVFEMRDVLTPEQQVRFDRTVTSEVDQAGADDDARLAVAAASGDTRAFGVLMRRHKDGIYRFCRRYVGDADDAYDLTQQTFISAWAALGRYDPNRALTTWLRAIALNKCRDHGRRATVRRLIFGTRSSTEAAMAEVPSDAPSAETQAHDQQAMRALDRALSTLPDALKTPLILTALDGLSTAQAADVMGVSPKAIETRLYRARKALGAQMEKTLADR